MEDFAKKYTHVGSGNSIFSSMPKAESFENFFEYEQALLDWKTNVEGYRTSVYLFTHFFSIEYWLLLSCLM